METRYFETLIKSVETGSFSKASEALHITQSAVSQRIKFLEGRYGHQLLDRSGPTLVPTEVGLLVLEKARGIVEKERELREELKRFGGEKRLSLCCTPTFGMAYLPGVLNAFMLQNADLTDLKFIFSQPEQALKGLQDNEFDLAIIEHCDDFDLAAFQTHPLPQDELVFVSAPGLDLPPSPFDLEVLLPYRLYARKDGCSSKELLRHNLVAQGKEIGDFKSVVISDDLRFTIQAVRSGGGVALVSRSLASGHLDSGRLCAHHVRGFNHYRCRTAVRRKGRKPDLVLESFLECVSAAFGSEESVPGVSALADGPG